MFERGRHSSRAIYGSLPRLGWSGELPWAKLKEKSPMTDISPGPPIQWAAMLQNKNVRTPNNSGPRWPDQGGRGWQKGEEIGWISVSGNRRNIAGSRWTAK